MPDELILIEKNGEQISVHPLSLADHKSLGWKVVERPIAEDPEPVPVVEQAKAVAPAPQPAAPVPDPKVSRPKGRGKS